MGRSRVPVGRTGFPVGRSRVPVVRSLVPVGRSRVAVGRSRVPVLVIDDVLSEEEAGGLQWLRGALREAATQALRTDAHLVEIEVQSTPESELTRQSCADRSVGRSLAHLGDAGGQPSAVDLQSAPHQRPRRSRRDGVGDPSQAQWIEPRPGHRGTVAIDR